MNDFDDIDNAVDFSIEQCPRCVCGRSTSYIILMWNSVNDPDWARNFLRSYSGLIWDDGIYKFKPLLHDKEIRIKGKMEYACSLVILMCEDCAMRTLKEEYEHRVPWIVCLRDDDANQFRSTINRS